MTTRIQFINNEAKDSIEALVNEKMEKLGQRYAWITNANVVFKKGKNEENRNFECEIKLSVPGPYIFAKSKETNFEKAFAETLSDLQVQLSKHKAKLIGR